MKTKIAIIRLAVVILMSAIGQRLAAQGLQNPNLGNTGGLYQPPSNAVLIATTSDGQDVSSGLTVTVGQPIPTVTFTTTAYGPALINHWDVFLKTAIGGLPYFGIAPGLTIASSAGSVIFIDAGNAPVSSVSGASEAKVSSTLVQLIGTPTQTGIFDIVLNGRDTNGDGSPLFDYFIHVNAVPILQPK